MFEQMAGTAARKQDIVVLRVPVDDEMGVRRQDDLIEFAVDDPLAFESGQAVTDVAAPFEMSLPAISKHLNILSANIKLIRAKCQLRLFGARFL